MPPPDLKTDDDALVSSNSGLLRSKSEQIVNETSSSEHKQATEQLLSRKRTASCDGRLVLIEEITPSQTKLFNGHSFMACTLEAENSKEDSSWKVPLNHFTSKRVHSLEQLKKFPRSIRRYYKKQEELIAAFEGIDLENVKTSSDDCPLKHRRLAVLMAKLSFFMNLLLLISKLVVAVLSGSLAVITSVLDSAVDLVSGLLMWWSGRAMKTRDPYLYPQGRTRLEPIAIIVLSVIMSLAMVQMIREAIEKIVLYAQYDLDKPEYHNSSVVFCLTIDEMAAYVHPGGDRTPVFEIDSIVICTVTIVIKLALFLVCRRIDSPATRALAQDHRNDVISNTGAIACGLIGYRLWKYADPIGAMVICIYIIFSWILMGQEQIKFLTGHTARPDFLSKLTWIAINHHPKVTHIDTVRAFHFGNDFLVEVDIVLPADMTLMEAHDIGEALQQRLESLNEVERAFVHLDYEVEHHPNSEHKVV